MPKVSAATLEGRGVIFNDILQALQKRYYDPSFSGVDWPSVSASFQSLAIRASDPAEFYRVLRRMLDALGDSHTAVYAPGEADAWQRLQRVTVGVEVGVVDRRVVVLKVEPGSQAEQNGVQAGDEVVSIDDQLASAFPEALSHEVARSPDAPGSNLRRLRRLRRLFDGSPGSSATIVFADARQRRKTIHLRRTLQYRSRQLHIERMNGSYGLIAFNLFTPETAAGVVRALGGELHGVRGLILDLRENSGGEAEAMVDVASLLLPPGKKLGSFINRDGHIVASLETRRRLMFDAGKPARFERPVVILTSVRTASAAEVFVNAMKQEGRATVVGEPTCGCVLGVRRPHRLPDGGLLMISETDYRAKTGTRLEGVGLKPDERIALSRDDLIHHRDPAIKRAIRHLEAHHKDR